MDIMNRCVSSWLLVAAGLGLVAGCGRGSAGPTKEIQVPSGGAPVLTVAERAEKEAQDVKKPRGPIALATFDQPIEEPQPLKPFDEWTEQEAAADALGRIGPAAVPPLVQSLASPDAGVRLKGVEVLGRMGPGAAEAVLPLVKLLDDPDVAVRKAAARTLGHIGPAAQDAVPALMRTLLQPAPQSP
jgi:hypothetical protein